MALAKIFDQHLVLQAISMYDPKREPGDPPSFCPRSLSEGEILVIYHLESTPSRRAVHSAGSGVPWSPEYRYTRDNMRQGLYRWQLATDRATKLQIEHIGGRSFLLAEVLMGPIKEPSSLVKSRLDGIASYCERVIS